ncbi:MAG: aminotransferase class I/II-fold pyridoxal phosphate-dependent enzyme, partial [Bacteroidales bacterium]|nr:aminotransferase class I/II-fold pyridoxal phosphate-dependent enzyme [Bacteroidales bacterium]
MLPHNLVEFDGHGYQPYVGLPELREAFARFYKRWYDVELDAKTEIQPLIGSKEGILHVTMTFVNPDLELWIGGMERLNN